MSHPILYSFRRCPYAMRARLAIKSAGVTVELREILLRDKPAAFLDTSPSATVPCLKDGNMVIDESLDIMLWASRQRDPAGWLDMPDMGFVLINQSDGPFKSALDRTKYATRYPDCVPTEQRAKASEFLIELNDRLAQTAWLFGARATLADYAILPFVRQFSNIDKTWFDSQPWPYLSKWLEQFLTSDDFAAIMPKYAAWQDGDQPIYF